MLLLILFHFVDVFYFFLERKCVFVECDCCVYVPFVESNAKNTVYTPVRRPVVDYKDTCYSMRTRQSVNRSNTFDFVSLNIYICFFFRFLSNLSFDSLLSRCPLCISYARHTIAYMLRGYFTLILLCGVAILYICYSHAKSIIFFSVCERAKWRNGEINTNKFANARKEGERKKQREIKKKKK